MQQLYEIKPTKLECVGGASSRAIYKFMKGGSKYLDKSDSNPWDMDDFERNRALLICYPEWKPRMKEMAIVSKRWKVLVENWDTIEEKYNDDYKKYGDKAYDIGECDKYIRELLYNITIDKMCEQTTLLNLYLVERTDKGNYDEYESFLVCCKTEQEARETFPAFRCVYDTNLQLWCDLDKVYGTDRYNRAGWIYGKDINSLKVKKIGIASEEYTGHDVLLSVYNSG